MDVTKNPTQMEATIRAARAAGGILRARFGRPLKVEYKGPIDIVTDADRASEAIIVKMLREEYPDYGFLTEEERAVTGQSDARWIVDPLDGTTNFAKSDPRFCVSIALELGAEVVLGVVFSPMRDELFAASRGGGSSLNGQPIAVSATETLGQAVIATGFPYDVWTSAADGLDGFDYFLRRAMSLRVTGSAALDLADVACGRRDAYWELGLKAYDVAAGVLLVREAGGVATNLGGNEDAVHSGEVLAANPRLHEQLASYFRDHHGAQS